jgi:5-methylcytosine-specific restriction endonuclease McrA
VTINPLRTREAVVIPDRPTPTKAQKTAAWNRENGLCRWCGKPVARDGVGVEWDHWIVRANSGDDSADNLVPLHPPCHRAKTYGPGGDRQQADKAKRQQKLTEPKVRKRSGLSKHPTLKRCMDGQVRPRRQETQR